MASGTAKSSLLYLQAGDRKNMLEKAWQKRQKSPLRRAGIDYPLEEAVLSREIFTSSVHCKFPTTSAKGREAGSTRPDPSSHSRSTSQAMYLEDFSLNFDRTFLPALYSLLFLLGLLGNGAVAAVLLSQRTALSSTDTFLLHLAVADVLLVLTLPLWAVDAAVQWVFGPGLCKVAGALFNINFYAGAFLLACISFDRYLSIVHATQIYRRDPRVRVALTCIVVWGLCLLFALPDFIYLSANYDQRLNATHCQYNFPQVGRTALRVLQLVAGFLLPLLVMAYCYAHILAVLLVSRGQRRFRAMRLVVVVVAAFAVCWTPYHLVVLVDILMDVGVLARNCGRESHVDVAKSVTSGMGYMHCCLNPLLYAFVGVKFREQMWMLFARLGRSDQRGPQRQPSSSRRESSWSETTEASYLGL